MRRKKLVDNMETKRPAMNKFCFLLICLHICMFVYLPVWLSGCLSMEYLVIKGLLVYTVQSS